VRQGCPLSPLLYVLCLEPVLNKIRADSAVKGLFLPGKPEGNKLAAFADDTKFLLSDEHSAHTVLQWFDTWGSASGAKLNRSKTEGMYLGWWRRREDTPRLSIAWVKTMKVFGILFGSVTQDDIWHPLYKKIDNTLRLFSGRTLSLYGKAQLVNVMVLSKLWYVATVVPPSRYYIDRIQKRVFDFIWSSGFEPIKRETMYLPREKGGIGLVNIKLKVQSLILRQVLKVVLSTEIPWTNFGHMYLGLRLARVSGYKFCNRLPHASMQDIPAFYKECIAGIDALMSAKPNLQLAQPWTCKTLYQLLLSAVGHPPRVTTDYPSVPFDKVFSDLKCPHLDPTTVDVSYKLAHNVLAVAYRLYQLNYPSVVKFCLMCNAGKVPTGPCETVEHLFFHCSFVETARNLLARWLSKVSSLTLTPEIVRFGPTCRDITNRSTVLVLLAEYRYAIWICRNKVRFDKKQPCASDFTRYFITRVHNRIHVDLFRLPQVAFTDFWVLPGLVQISPRGKPLLGSN
jgi:hypothetical protein